MKKEEYEKKIRELTEELNRTEEQLTLHTLTYEFIKDTIIAYHKSLSDRVSKIDNDYFDMTRDEITILGAQMSIEILAHKLHIAL